MYNLKHYYCFSRRDNSSTKDKLKTHPEHRRFKTMHRVLNVVRNYSKAKNVWVKNSLMSNVSLFFSTPEVFGALGYLTGACLLHSHLKAKYNTEF